MGASAAEPVASPPFSPRLQRQRSLASVISTRCCSNLCVGRNSLSGYDFEELFHHFPTSKAVGGFSLQRTQKQASLWQESSSRLLGSRRYRGSRRGNVFCSGGGACPEVDEGDDASYCKPSPWKLFLRKLRAETKKMNCTRPSPPAGFHYDALSYAMNFDDGGWQPPQQYFYTSQHGSFFQA